MNTAVWKTQPDEHDYPAAASYLSLIATAPQIAGVIDQFEHGGTAHHQAKDILRACGLPLLREDTTHVASDLKKIKAGKPLSPVLLVRGDILNGVHLTIADGYHRVCASYLVDEDADIPCRIADLPTHQNADLITARSDDGRQVGSES